MRRGSPGSLALEVLVRRAGREVLEIAVQATYTEGARHHGWNSIVLPAGFAHLTERVKRMLVAARDE